MTARERPILFSAPMVRAILSGAKTQTRRIVKHHPVPWNSDSTAWDMTRCPFGMPGAELWVRETWAVGHGYDGHKPSEIPALSYVRRHYAATEERGGLLWRPSIFMPRWASRITLEVTAVRVERLQDISESDAIAEGGTEAMRGWWTHEGLQWNDPGPNHRFGATPIDSYRVLWESINGPGSWGANPWVWAINFKRLA